MTAKIGITFLTALASALAEGASTERGQISLSTVSNLPNYPVGIVDAFWDGQNFYPKPTDKFDATKYVGPEPSGDSRAVWYSWAASEQPFLTSCRCVYARYGTYPNGSISVENFCTRGTSQSSIQGYAAPTPDFGNGSFQVVFFGQKPKQKGPNYVVTRAYSNIPAKARVEAEISNEPYQTVIVGTQNFTGWFLLSRTREVSTQIVDEYLREVGKAGFNLTSPYKIYDQSRCGTEPTFTPVNQP